jgi:hypothetical protein
VTALPELLARAVLLGVAGAMAMDAWAWLARRGLGIRGLDYGLLGRWIGHMSRGRFVHERIAAAAPVPGERPLGWLAHYAIGVAFAVVLLGLAGLEWAREPTLLPPLIVGFGTILAPWLVMQPAMGAGVAGSRTPDPRATRLRNLATHAVYGLGLYASAVVLSIVWA